MKQTKKHAAVRNSAEDAKTIIDESAHIPDRDQVFSSSSHSVSTRPSGENDAHDDSWSGDLEDEVKGDRDSAGDAVDELAHLQGFDHVPTADELSQEGGAMPPGREPAMEREAATLPRQTTSGELGEAAADHSAIRAQLEGRRRDLMEVILAHEKQIIEKITPNESGESKVDFNHPADMIDGEADFEKNMTIVAAERAELALVNEALFRLDKGDYGFCQACGSDIPLPRLKAIPFTKHCIACQARMEHRTRGGGAGAEARA
jgi:RNA polymerase-binding protein DksA